MSKVGIRVNMEEVIALVNTNRGDGRKESLQRMHRLMDKLGNPQDACRYIHIAGTNGKGTTCAFVASILQEAGLKTGLFISPHLEVINERMRINGTYISDEEFIEATQLVAPYVEEVEEELQETLYSFEILTAVAFVYFSKQACDIVVLETGIGGRLDSTNVIQTPEVAVLTSVGLDHLSMLGNSIEEIATEKAEIIKENGTLISYHAPESIHEIIQKKTDSVQAQMKEIEESTIKWMHSSIEGEQFSYQRFSSLHTRMIGEHQVKNAVLAIEAATTLQEKGWKISDQHIKTGIEKAFWPGRMEKLQDQPLVLIDGAHNEHGVTVLRKNLDRLFPEKKLHLVMGMMKDKAYMEMIEKVADKAASFTFISPDPWRGFDAEDVAEKVKAKGYNAQAIKDVADIRSFIQTCSKEESVIVFGSLYLIGDMRKKWK